MKFSIIIPIYNVEAYLTDCLNSVLNQTWNDFEVICINDGSTDKSLQIAEEFASKDKRIKIISQPNGGLSAARNTGIRTAKGEYLFFLDSDDWIENFTLETLDNNLGQAPDILCFSGQRHFENGTLEEADQAYCEEAINGWEYYNKYALKPTKFHFVSVVLRIYKRSFLEKHQLFFEEEIYHEDNLFTPIVCYYAKNIKVISDPLYTYRIREGSITTSSDKKQLRKRLEDIVYVANALADFFTPIEHIDKSIIYREIAGVYFKGFMSDVIKIFGDNDKLLADLINWNSFKTVAVYPRHKRIYHLLSISPSVFRVYIRMEVFVKRLRIRI